MSFLTFDKAGRKGFTLVIVMVMSILMGLSAMALFSSASLDTMIAGNIRRSTIAKHAAVSGINHFMSDDLYKIEFFFETIPINVIFLFRFAY